MRLRVLLGIVLIALLVLLAGRPRPARADVPQGIAESIPTKCRVEGLTAGKEGDVWFGCTVETHYGYGTVPKVGHVDAAGAASEFGGGKLPKNTEPASLTIAPDGSAWVALNGYFELYGKRPAPRLARITPSGEVKLFKLPLGREYNVVQLVAGAGGYLWFTTATHEESNHPALWQVAPSGAISKLPIELGEGFPTFTVGPEGDLWFVRETPGRPPRNVLVRLPPGGLPTEIGTEIPNAALGLPDFEANGSAWLFLGGSSLGAHTLGAARLSPTGQITDTGAQIPIADGEISGGATVGVEGDLWLGVQGGPLSSIRRVTQSGVVTSFNKCLSYSQPFFGPEQLTTATDGSIYWTSIASRELPSISDPPSIGRITPSGEITQIYAGVDGEARSILPGTDGSVWFSAGGNEIQRIKAPTGPINTFHFTQGRKFSSTGAGNVRVIVPGPGEVSVEPTYFLPRHHAKIPIKGTRATATSTACGAVGLPIAPVGAAKAAFHKRGFTNEEVAVTFTPTGGTPYTEDVQVYLSGGKPHESAAERHPGPPPPGTSHRRSLGVPQPHRQYPIRPAHLFFRYDPPDEEDPASHVYPPFSLTGLKWSQWYRSQGRHGVAAKALATGRIHYDSCRPGCAGGRYVTAPARVELNGEGFCFIDGHEIDFFQQLTVAVAGGEPRTRYIECDGHLRSARRSAVIPPGVGFLH